MAILKLSGLLLCAFVFFWLFVFGPYYNHVGIQLCVLIGVLVWNSLRFTIKETLSLLKFCLPFVVCLFVFGLIFHFIQLLGRQDWLEDTLIKCMIFPSSLIVLQLLLSYVTYLDILRLPLSMKRRVDLITMKSAFQKGGKILTRFTWYINTYTGLKSGRRIRYELTKYACLVIALYLYLYEEIENSNRLLKNRYRHLFEVNE